MASLKNHIGRSGWNIVIILSCVGLIVMFDETMILPAIPDFIHNFKISYSMSSWLLSAYIIAAAVMTPIGGKLSDIYGKKKILLIIMAVYAIGIMAGFLEGCYRVLEWLCFPLLLVSFEKFFLTKSLLSTKLYSAQQFLEGQ